MSEPLEPDPSSLKTPLARTVFAIAERKGRVSPERARSLPLLELAIGDITLEDSDAILCPTGGGLVDLAVRRAAGPELAAAVEKAIAERTPPALPPGQIVVTDGFGLRAKHVLHCSPPSYSNDPARARAELAACHLEALAVARRLGLVSLSLPAIATGAFRFPTPEAAAIATRVLVQELRRDPRPHLMRVVLYGPATLDVYADAARRQLGQP